MDTLDLNYAMTDYLRICEVDKFKGAINLKKLETYSKAKFLDLTQFQPNRQTKG